MIKLKNILMEQGMAGGMAGNTSGAVGRPSGPTGETDADRKRYDQIAADKIDYNAYVKTPPNWIVTKLDAEFFYRSKADGYVDNKFNVISDFKKYLQSADSYEVSPRRANCVDPATFALSQWIDINGKSGFPRLDNNRDVIDDNAALAMGSDVCKPTDGDNNWRLNAIRQLYNGKVRVNLRNGKITWNGKKLLKKLGNSNFTTWSNYIQKHLKLLKGRAPGFLGSSMIKKLGLKGKDMEANWPSNWQQINYGAYGSYLADLEKGSMTKLMDKSFGDGLMYARSKSQTASYMSNKSVTGPATFQGRKPRFSRIGSIDGPALFFKFKGIEYIYCYFNSKPYFLRIV